MQIEKEMIRSYLRDLDMPSPSRGPNHRQLKAFAGHWQIEGEKKKNGVTTSVHGDEIYEWLDGDFFLVNRFDHSTSSENYKGLGWIYYDVASRNYLSYSISNLGSLRVYEVEISDHQMIFSGESERATIKLSPDGQTLFIYWDHCPDGENWQSLYNLRGHLQIPQSLV